MLHYNHLKQLDLQDMVLFLTLLEQRSAKRTAKIMNISQPTVSYCLKRLRICFDDILFSSSHGTLMPTDKAEIIAPYLRVAVESVNRCAESNFLPNAGKMTKVWKICAPEYFELSLLPYILGHIAGKIPNVSLHFEKLGRGIPIDKLLGGDLDLSIGFGPGYHQMHPELAWEPLLTDEFVCLTSHSRVDQNAPVSIDEFCAIPSVFPTPWESDKNMIDSWLDKIGRSRNVLSKVNSYQASINILSKVPAILALPAGLINLLNIPNGVHICQPPLGFPTFTLDIIWLREISQSQELSNLRELIKLTSSKLVKSNVTT